MIATIGFFAGAAQLLGYIFYIKKTKYEDISPNPTTWLIFAFDTAILTILEMVSGAKASILFLPVMCSIGGIYVAWLVRKSGRLEWPSDTLDAYILKTGIAVTLIYSVVFLLWKFSNLPTDFLYLTGFIFLILSNLNTFVAFVPIIREIYQEPHKENAGPWTIWTIAYFLLLVVTYLEVGNDPTGYIFYIYPISCLFLHGSVAWLARDKRK